VERIGLIGGMTPQSTILYYQILNELATQKYGEKHSCKVVVSAVNFGELSQLQSENRWDLLDAMMAEEAKRLEIAGARCILITANTMHLCIDAVRSAVNIPVLHIAEATAKEIHAKKIKKVALLGTKYTMERTFYTDVLTKEGIETIIPDQEDRDIIHEVIYKELAKGVINPESKKKYQKSIDALISKEAEGIILGCTEIPLLITQADVKVPVFDTTAIHARAGFEFITASS
jgi:aspartate racemase